MDDIRCAICGDSCGGTDSIGDQRRENQGDDPAEKEGEANPNDGMTTLAHERARRLIRFTCVEGVWFEFGGHRDDANTLENSAAT
jgi:hypothetical protein